MTTDDDFFISLISCPLISEHKTLCLISYTQDCVHYTLNEIHKTCDSINTGPWIKCCRALAPVSPVTTATSRYCWRKCPSTVAAKPQQGLQHCVFRMETGIQIWKIMVSVWRLSQQYREGGWPEKKEVSPLLQLLKKTELLDAFSHINIKYNKKAQHNWILTLLIDWRLIVFKGHLCSTI